MAEKERKALFRDNAPMACTGLTSVDGLELSGIEPEGTKRRVLFSYVTSSEAKKASEDPYYFKLAVEDGVGTMIAVDTQEITTDSVLSEGNTVSELAAVTSIPEWVGKTVYPIIALSAPRDSMLVPTLKMGIKTTNSNEAYTKTEISSDIVLSESNVTVTKCEAAITATDGGAVTVTGSVYDNGAWSDYLSLTELRGKTGSKVRFKAVYTVTRIGASVARLDSVTIAFAEGGAHVSGADAAIVISAKDVDMDVSYVRSSLIHSELKDADLSAFVCFSQGISTRDKLEIGVGTGVKQSFALADANINPSTIKCFSGQGRVYDFDYNMVDKSLSFIGAKDEKCYVSYDYNIPAEDWRPMDKGETDRYQQDQDRFSTKFYYTLPDGEDAKHIMAIKYVLTRVPGEAEEALGEATGKNQPFTLAHVTDADHLAIEGAEFSLDNTGKSGILVAPKGTSLTAVYSYKGEAPVVESYITAFNHK